MQAAYYDPLVGFNVGRPLTGIMMGQQRGVKLEGPHQEEGEGGVGGWADEKQDCHTRIRCFPC